MNDNLGNPFPREVYKHLQEQLTEKFGGVTAYTRSPASGTWNDEAGATRHDEVVLFEIMAETLDAAFWQTLKGKLADQFEQDDVIVRATEITCL
ncbi:hypothetical protein LB569_30800 [Mesorhizobium sp. BH1-1-4]|nr:hypothetical protein [Mesorhizobium sp. BH1-1-4]